MASGQPPAQSAPFNSPMPALFLRQFLDSRGLEVPDGRPLYAYRCTGTEHRQLEAILRASLANTPSHRPVGPITAMIFCLWAAEWWRRNHSGGSWRWEDMLEALGCGDFAPGRPRYSQLCKAVAEGLRVWRRDLLRVGQGRGFLVTLACEGGLPLRLILREQAKLRQYFNALLEEFRS